VAPNTIPESQIPSVPPTPIEVHANAPPPANTTTNIPPIGPGSAVSAPARPAKKRRTWRSFFIRWILLAALGYGGGVYFSLVNDNFHDFFTEYVPYGEDAVAYFEDREFRKRFPKGAFESKNWPQTRGENKVTIGRSSGVNPRVADSATSATEDSKSKLSEKVSDVSHKLLPKQDAAMTSAKDSSSKSSASTTQKSKPEPAPKPAATLVDHVNVPEANEPAVQELVKMLNNIITTVNASPDAAKYSNVMITAKEDLHKIISSIRTLKESASQDAEAKVSQANTEFDKAAQELVSRLEREMRDQETRWREEYENERERLSTSYQQKLAAELDAAKKIADEKTKKSLLEQEISIQEKFLDSVKSKVEEERDGRLSKLNELSASVDELEKLTGQWNSVVDATLKTQHLQVALEAVRAKLQASEYPTPFLDELVALKEVSQGNDVVNAAIASINPTAYQRGVPSIASLIDRFRRVATEVRKASLLPADAGIASHAASAVLSRLMFSKKSDRGLPEGDDVEAILARTEVLLEEGDVDAAAREMNGLKGWAGVLSKDWVGECRRVLEVRQAVEVSNIRSSIFVFSGRLRDRSCTDSTS
jgi:mitofilin